MRPKTLGMSKVAVAEARVGMGRSEYFRTHNDLTQGEMAGELGVSTGTVIRWMKELGLVIQRRVIRRRGVAA